MSGPRRIGADLPDVLAEARRIRDDRTGRRYLELPRRKSTPKPANFRQMVEDAKRERANPG